MLNEIKFISFAIWIPFSQIPQQLGIQRKTTFWSQGKFHLCLTQLYVCSLCAFNMKSFEGYVVLALIHSAYTLVLIHNLIF